MASGTLALAGAGKLSLDELLHQRFGGGRLALLSAVVTATATALVLHRRQTALTDQTATTTSTTAPTTSPPGRRHPPAPGEPTTPPIPHGATEQADNGPVET